MVKHQRLLIVLLIISISANVVSVLKPSQATAMAISAEVGAAAEPPNKPIASAGSVSSTRAGGSSGSATTSVPIELPPFHGREPYLSLNYNSERGNGWVGVGWQLTGVSQITRTSFARGTPRFRTDDVFFLDTEQLVPCAVTQGQPNPIGPACNLNLPAPGSPGCAAKDHLDVAAYYTTRSAMGLLICHTSSSTHSVEEEWTVTDKSGTSSNFTAAVSAPEGPIRFDLRSSRDRLGNEITYSWTGAGRPAEELPQLAEISYNYNNVRVHFYEESRPDVITGAIGGAVTQTSHRLRSIEVTALGRPVRAYALNYQLSLDTQRSILESVKAYGNDATVDSSGVVTGTPLPAQTFTNDASSPTPPSSVEVDRSGIENTATEPGYALNSPIDVAHYNGDYRLGDFTNTGRSGVAFLEPTNGSTVRCPGRRTFVVRQTTPGPTTTVKLETPAPGFCFTISQWFAADANGDGLADLIVVYRTSATYGQTPSPGRLYPSWDSYWVSFYPNLGDGAFASKPVLRTAASFINGTYDTYDCDVGDVNGNRHLAVVCLSYYHSPRLFAAFSHEARLETFQLDRANSTVAVAAVYPDLGGVSDVKYQDHRILLGDVDGDGKADVVHPVHVGNLSIAGSDQRAQGLQILRSKGDGAFEPKIEQVVPTEISSAWQDPAVSTQLVDLNGDGLADFSAVTYQHVGDLQSIQGSPTIASAISGGDGSWRFATQPVPAFLQPAGDKPVAVMFSLFTGDGSTGLTFAVPRDKHAAPSNCAPAIDYDHIEVVRAASNGDGTFSWPSSLDDCSAVQEVAVRVEGGFWENIGAFFAGVGQFFAGYSAGGAVDRSVGDADGDGLADTIMVVRRTAAGKPSIVVAYPPKMAVAPMNWQSVDVAGDGGGGYLSVSSDYTDVQVRSLRPRIAVPPDRCFKQPNLAGCEPYVLTTQTLTKPADPASLAKQAVFTSRRDGWRALDLDGHGDPSLVYVDSSQRGSTEGEPVTRVLSYARQGQGWATTPVMAQFPRARQSSMSQWMAGDVNGHGQTALVAVELLGQELQVHALIHTPDGGWTQTSRNYPRPPNIDGTWRAFNVNGDAITDFVQLSHGAGGVTITTLIGDGPTGGWSLSQSPLLVDPSFDGNLASWLDGDFTGDGVTDLAHINQTGDHLVVTVLAALGDGTWEAAPQVDIEIPNQGTAPRSQWVAYDTNSDGLADLTHLAPRQNASVLGATTTLTTLRTSSAGATFTLTPSAEVVSPSRNSFSWMPTDTNADGAVDLGNVTIADGRYQIAQITQPVRGDRLTVVQNGIGGRATLTYAAGRQWRLGKDTESYCGVPAGTGLVATATLTTDTGGKSTTQSFDYSCPQWAPTDHQILGWRVTAIVRAPTGATAGNTVTTTHSLSASCGDRIDSTTNVDAAGRVLHLDRFDYSTTGDDELSTLCGATGHKSRDCADTEPCPSDNTGTAYDDYGNITSLQQYMSTAVTNELSNYRTTSTTYQYSASPYLANLARSVELSAGSPDDHIVLRRTDACYDDSCDGPAAVPRGLPTQVTDFDVTGDAPPRTTVTRYDEVGNIVAVTDPKGNATLTTYDTALHVYPVAHTDPLGHTQQQAWDEALGVPISSTDLNGLTTTWTHDPYGRPTGVTDPSGTTNHVVYLQDGSDQQHIHSSLDDGSADGVWTDVYYDGLGRVTDRIRKSDTPDANESTHTSYADAGTNPASQTHWARGTVADVPTEVYTYDALGWVASQTHPDGSTLTANRTASPQGTVLNHTDESGRGTAVTFDAWNRQTSVTQHSTADSVATLNYEYNLSDELVTITDAANNRTTRTIDSFGQITAEQDSDRGGTTYTHDLNGNLKSSTDARAITTTYEHDELNRTTSETHSGDPAAATTTWHYDENGHGPSIGALTSISDASADGCPDRLSEARTYDQFGRPDSITSCVAGHRVRQRTSYDEANRPSSLTYPNGEVVRYSYGPSGRLSAAGRYAKSAQYDPSGRLVELTLGNNVKEHWTVDPARGWLVGNDAQLDQSTLYDSRITRSTDGLIAALTSTTEGNNQSFQYDTLGRLTTASGETAATDAYDGTGNITETTTGGTYGYGEQLCPDGGTPAHGATRIGVPGDPYAEQLCYDKAGNRTSVKRPYDSQAITWSAAGTAQSITSTATAPAGGNDQTVTATQLTYNASGQLVRQQATSPGSAVDIRYFGPSAQWQPDLGNASIIYFDDVLVARHDSSGDRYYVTDHLGSPRMVIDGGGTVTARIGYDPWGAGRIVSGILPKGTPGFTGGITIENSSYVQLGVRLYDASLGAFISADSVALASDDVQANNRYAYARNNPLSYTDPTGHNADGFDDSSEIASIPPPMETPWYLSESLKGSMIYDFTEEESDAIRAHGSLPEESIKTKSLIDEVTEAWNGLTFEEKAGAAIFGGIAVAALTVTLFPTVGLGLLVGVSYETAFGISSVATFLAGASPASDLEAATARTGGMETARRLGIAGEKAAGIIQANKERIPSWTGSAPYRIADELTDTMVKEVKNVAALRFTPQLQDFYLYALSTGRTFALVVRQNTMLSSELRTMETNGLIQVIRTLPAR